MNSLKQQVFKNLTGLTYKLKLDKHFLLIFLFSSDLSNHDLIVYNCIMLIYLLCHLIILINVLNCVYLGVCMPLTRHTTIIITDEHCPVELAKVKVPKLSLLWLVQSLICESARPLDGHESFIAINDEYSN